MHGQKNIKISRYVLEFIKYCCLHTHTHTHTHTRHKAKLDCTQHMICKCLTKSGQRETYIHTASR